MSSSRTDPGETSDSPFAGLPSDAHRKELPRTSAQTRIRKGVAYAIFVLGMATLVWGVVLTMYGYEKLTIRVVLIGGLAVCFLGLAVHDRRLPSLIQEFRHWLRRNQRSSDEP